MDSNCHSFSPLQTCLVLEIHGAPDIPQLQKRSWLSILKMGLGTDLPPSTPAFSVACPRPPPAQHRRTPGPAVPGRVTVTWPGTGSHPRVRGALEFSIREKRRRPARTPRARQDPHPECSAQGLTLTLHRAARHPPP